MKKRVLVLLLVVVLVMSCLSVGAAAALSSDWTTWSQGGTSLTSEWYQKSDGSSAVALGACRLFAQAKLLAESGVIDPAKFDADDYVVWMEEHGYIYGRYNGQYYVGETSATGSGMIAYAAAQGVTITRVATIQTSSYSSAQDRVDDVYNYIQQGYYVILGCTAHHTYIAREMSLSEGKPIISDSGSDKSTAVTRVYHGSSAAGDNVDFTEIYVYSVSGTPTTPTTPDAPAASVVTINYAAETISYDSSKYEVSASTSFSSIISSGGSISSLLGSISDPIYVRVKQDGSTPASDATKVTLPGRSSFIPMDFVNYADETFASTSAMEYSLNGSTWTKCTGPTPISAAGSSSKIYFRYAATSTAFASSSAEVAVPTRSAAPSADVVTIDYANETVSFDAAYELNTAADFSGSAIVSGGAIQPGSSVYVRAKATSSALASASAQVSIPARPAAPEVAAADETIDGKADGKITGVSEAMEYRAASGSWTACEGESVDGLDDGVYEVRSMSTESSFASEAATVTVGKGVPATYTLDLEIAEIETEIYNYAQPEGSALVLTSAGNSRAEIVSVSVDNTDAFEIVGSGQYVEAGGRLDSYIVRPRTGLEAGDYAATVTVTYKGGESYSGDETFTVAADIAFTVEKAPQAAPKAPELYKRELYSITLKALPDNANGAQAQYRMNGGAWQTSPVFEDLRAGTSYTFEQRYAAVGSYLASEPSVAAEFTTAYLFSGDTYDINISETVNGSVKSSLSNSSGGARIVLTVTPDEGFSLGSLRVVAEAGGSVAVVREKDGSYSFTMPDCAVTVYAEFTDGSVRLPFLDVPASAWYYDAVCYVYASGMMQGVTDTSFSPDSTMTRAMSWTVLARIDGRAVDGGSPWYAKAQSWATGSGISDGTLPDDIVTREQFVTMLWRYAGSPAAFGGLSGFPDASAVSSWAYDAMCWAVSNGIIEGTDGGALSPGAGITRAQAAAIFMRYTEL